MNCSILHQALCIISKPLVNSNWSDSPETLNSGQNRRFFCLAWPWWMTLKNNRAPLLYYVKHCASFQSRLLILIGVTVRKRWIPVKIDDFCPVWPRNLMDDLENPYGTSSILPQALCIISKPSVYTNLSYSPETPNMRQNLRFFVLCGIEICWTTLKNNRAPLLCCFKLGASHHSHQWI